MIVLPSCPFGDDITAEDIVQTMKELKGWEDRYRQVIQWGKTLPVMPQGLKSQQVTVSGCESLVWLVSQKTDQRWYFCADSDARIVRGLIAIVMAAYNGKTTCEIEAFEIDDYFSKLGLIAHLSPSRGNGLWSIVTHIKHLSQPTK
ncbi:cysteine desulfurase sulfur acceptor subunit CsdE [Vibrio ostreicida]|uniref:cysteine desulfurase sulfur acceptor subunit CsdE n=1 Tax=Vibrio ostreicida TaxID=526588 RepID=UPI0009711605|nr:cysteine desulfurase sulfur acceptor subunit CsdE [Vibrio ostreicida]